MDGTNATLNSGRFLINLKDKSDRDGVTTIMDRLAADAHAVPGITFYLQPVQDLTIDSTVSRAEYQFVLQSATTATLNDFVPKLLAQLQKSPTPCATSRPTISTAACRPISPWTAIPRRDSALPRQP